MTSMDWTALAVMGSAAFVSAASFALIANYLFEHGLADRNQPPTNIFDVYKQYRRHTQATMGAVPLLFGVHVAAAATFIGAGLLYTLARFVFQWTF